jgi:transposase
MMRQTYRQEWHEYNLAQTNEKSRFLELLFELCAGIDEPIQTFGRPRLSFSDMIFCTAFKIYSTVSSRRFISDLRDATEKGYISKTPHFNSISNYLEMETLTPYLKQLIAESSRPLSVVERDFAVDSSGFSTGQFTRWIWSKYGVNPHLRDREEWVKVHLMCGVKTNVVTSIEITDRKAADSPQFKPLIEATARNFRMDEVSADKAYLSTANLRLVTDKRAMPYIPFKANSTASSRSTKQDPMWKWFFHYYMANQERYMQHYHKRSNVETTFSMIKGKFGERLRSKTKTAQINEVLCKVLCHNICCLIHSIYELGVEPSFWTEQI